MGYWAIMKGCWAATQKRPLRLTVGVSNELQITRNLTGGLPVVYQGHLASLGPFRERLTPAHEKETRGVHRRMWECRIAKRTTGKMLGCMRRTRMQMGCTWWHDMICMTWIKMQNKRQKPNHGGNIISHSRKWQELELQRWKVTSGDFRITIS